MANNFMWHAVEVLIHCRDNACRNIQNFNLSQAQLCNSHVEDPSVRILPQFGRQKFCVSLFKISAALYKNISILVIFDTGWNTFLKGKTLYSGTSKHYLFRNLKKGNCILEWEIPCIRDKNLQKKWSSRDSAHFTADTWGHCTYRKKFDLKKLIFLHKGRVKHVTCTQLHVYPINEYLLKL